LPLRIVDDPVDLALQPRIVKDPVETCPTLQSRIVETDLNDEVYEVSNDEVVTSQDLTPNGLVGLPALVSLTVWDLLPRNRPGLCQTRREECFNTVTACVGESLPNADSPVTEDSDSDNLDTVTKVTHHDYEIFEDTPPQSVPVQVAYASVAQVPAMRARVAQVPAVHAPVAQVPTVQAPVAHVPAVHAPVATASVRHDLAVQNHPTGSSPTGDLQVVLPLIHADASTCHGVAIQNHLTVSSPTGDLQVASPLTHDFDGINITGQQRDCTIQQHTHCVPRELSPLPPLPPPKRPPRPTAPPYHNHEHDTAQTSRVLVPHQQHETQKIVELNTDRHWVKRRFQNSEDCKRSLRNEAPTRADYPQVCQSITVPTHPAVTYPFR
jgi:hypothetical protein